MVEAVLGLVSALLVTMIGGTAIIYRALGKVEQKHDNLNLHLESHSKEITTLAKKVDELSETLDSRLGNVEHLCQSLLKGGS